MWQLPIIKNDLYNCFQYLVVTVSKYYNCDYRLMMLELWGFSYNKMAGLTIGDKLKLCWNSKIEKRKQLLEYHGISFEVKDVENINLTQFISQNIEKRPIAMYADSFICHWIPFYQKMHRPHSFFIIGSEENNYYILDQYCIDGIPQIISGEFLKNYTTRVITFNQDKGGKNDILNYIGENLKIWEQYGFEQYDSFIADMKSNLDIEQEIKDDPVSSKLVMYLKNLSEDRSNFIETICLFEELFSMNMYPVKELLSDIANRYQKLRAYLIKCSILHKYPKKDIISNEMDYIYMAEKKIYRFIKDLYNNYVIV